MYEMKSEYLKMMKMIHDGEEREEIPHRLIVIPIRFMGRDGMIHEKKLGLAIPEDVMFPCPVIFIAHYGIDEKTVGKHEGLCRGFAVAGNLENIPADNALLFDDDLYFNSACIDALRSRPEIDSEKIVIMGGSAGGYQTLMLSALHLGIAASIDFSGFVNPNFNMVSYAGAIISANMEAFLAMPLEERKDIGKMMEYLPMPIHMAVFQTFASDHPSDGRNACMRFSWSPVGLSACYSNPVILIHNTADSLVPIDQITRAYTYAENGVSMPDGLSLRLADYEFEEAESSKAFTELLPEEAYSMIRITAPEKGTEKQAPFDGKKKLQIIIIDDGCPEAWNGHAAVSSGTVSAMDYIEYILSCEPGKLQTLSDEKLLLLLQKAAGVCPVFPLFQSEEKGVYGTPEQVRNSVFSELCEYAELCGNREFLFQRIRDIISEHEELNAVQKFWRIKEEIESGTLS